MMTLVYSFKSARGEKKKGLMKEMVWRTRHQTIY